jgi:hypothetical protein
MDRKEIERGSLLKGLTKKQIDQSLLDPNRRWGFFNKEPYPSITEFSNEAIKHLRTKGINRNEWAFPNNLEIERSHNLKRFLKLNRPETLFFKPEEIVQRLNSSSNIVVKSTKTKKYEQWEFRLNSQKFPLGEDDIEHKITYRKPLTRAEIDHPEPYIVIDFKAKYSDGWIIFNPVIEATYGDLWSREGELLRQMLAYLDIPKKRVRQKIDFRLQKKVENLSNGKTRNKYIVTACIPESKH